MVIDPDSRESGVWMLNSRASHTLGAYTRLAILSSLLDLVSKIFYHVR